MTPRTYLLTCLILGLLAALPPFLAGCASSPEATLKRGYQTVSAAAKGTTVLLQRDVVGVKEAEGVLELGVQAKAMLDAGKDRLKKCREAQAADPTVKCDTAVANIELGAGVLGELERYLERVTKEAK